MGRRFTGASSDRIFVGTTAAAAGLTFTFGTMAVCLYRESGGSTMSYLSTNQAAGACAVLTTLSTADELEWYDGTNGRTGATSIATSGHVLLVATKATGTATPRFHYYEFATNTWVHEDASGTAVNGGTLSSLTIGSGGNSASFNAVDGEVHALGMWQGLAMSDGECERLARGSWLNYAPSFYEQGTPGHESGDMVRTLGRFPARQTAISGTTRGNRGAPPGFRMGVQHRRR